MIQSSIEQSGSSLVGCIGDGAAALKTLRRRSHLQRVPHPLHAGLVLQLERDDLWATGRRRVSALARTQHSDAAESAR